MVKEKKDTKELLNELEQEMVRVEKEKVDLRNDKERIAYLEHLCENIKEAKKQCEDIKFEYGQVTSYLKDIQLIDRAPKEEQEKLLAAAKQIVELTKERKKSQKQEYKRHKNRHDKRNINIHLKACHQNRKHCKGCYQKCCQAFSKYL